MISIVMSTFNRPAQLSNTLNSIQKQGFTGEVIVVDDGTDGITKGVCESYNAICIKLDRPLSHLVRTPSRPNNIGIRTAKGDIIILQNAECKHIDPNTIERLTSSVTDRNVVFAKVIALFEDGSNRMVYCGKENPRPYFFCGAIKKAWLEKIRGFDEDYMYSGYDDDDMGTRLAREGLQFEFSDIEVHHQWHDSGGVIDPEPALDMYRRKCAEMDAGTIGTTRNLNREWGFIDKGREPEIVNKELVPTTEILREFTPAPPKPLVLPKQSKPACPSCQAVCLVVTNGNTRCNQCGQQYL